MRIKGVSETFARIDADTRQTVAVQSLAAQEKAFALIVAATPVDTGRAVGSWAMGFTPSLHDRDVNGAGNRSALSRDAYDLQAYTTNGTPYIQVLNNEGTSVQARQFFVEEANLRAGLSGSIESTDGGV